jgi:uncharacterized protein with NAD-binding domain and iron-sulfur cluster
MAKTKVAILGGGIGALAAAFDLTEQDRDGSRFDITLYQIGWRLGGKCAVGWSGDGKIEPKVRYEHGLHVWAGYYDNAFDLLQRCYDATDARPFRHWRDAFEPLNVCWVEEWLNGAWEPWHQQWAPNGLTPGLGQVTPPDQLWTALLNLVSDVFRASNLTEVAREYHKGRPPQNPQVPQLQQAAPRLTTEKFGISGDGMDPFLTLLQLVGDEFTEQPFVGAAPDVRRLAILVNLALALLMGMLEGNVLSEGFDGLDAQEWSDWMRAHGAWTMTLDSALVRGFYDYVFGARWPDRFVGAGTGTRALLRLLFDYKGSFFYAMNMTMGEFLLAPLYKVLSGRHVEFNFFHRVDKLILSDDQKNIDKIEVGIQIKPKAASYDPLITIELSNGSYKPRIHTSNTIRSWPNQPLYDRLREGEKLERSGADLESPASAKVWQDVDKKTLLRGDDFNVVVLGISVGGLKTVCADLSGRLPAWQNMLEHVETTPTMAMQLWLERSPEDYGWPHQQPIVTAMRGALTTWGDNSQLIDQEHWPDKAPASLA